MRRVSNTPRFSLLNCFNSFRGVFLRAYHWLVALFNRDSHTTNNVTTQANYQPLVTQPVQLQMKLPDSPCENNIVKSTDFDTEPEVKFPAIITKTPSPMTNEEFFTDIRSSIFDKLDQTLLTNPSNYCYLKLHHSVNNMDIQPGVSFLSFCSNLEFHDEIIPVLIAKGYYTDSGGLFTLNEELWELICPKCKQPISGNNPQGIGFSQCSVRVKYRDVNRVTDAFTVNVPNDSFAFAKISQPGNVRYHYVKFQVEM